MKWCFWGICMMMVLPWSSAAQVIRTVGGVGADYVTLKSAFNDINSGLVQGEILLSITGNTVESEVATLSASGQGGAVYTRLTMFPAQPGLNISGNINGPLIHFNGADMVTIDGRVNGSGARDLVIANSSTGTSASTLYISGGASGDTVRYCVIKGATKCTISGVVHFGGAGVTANTGNVIDHCLITRDAAGMPVNLIYSYGSTMKPNSATISCNELCDFYSNTGNAHAMYINSYSDYWDVHHNSIYQTSPVAAANVTLFGFRNTGGTGIRVFSNFVGGSGAELVGNPWSISGTGAIRFVGISVIALPGSVSEVFDNRIGHFSWSSTSCSGSLPGIWTGIWIRGGSSNVGILGGNIIGATTGTGNVTIISNCGGMIVSSFGIATHTTGSGDVDIRNNLVGSVTVGCTSAASGTGHRFTGIQVNYGGSRIINNQIGSLETARSIQALSGQVTTSVSNSQDLAGIHCTYPGSGGLVIEGNLISNLFNDWQVTGSGMGMTRGIVVSSCTGDLTIRGNTVREISSSSNNTAGGSSEALTGILVTSTPAALNLSGNLVSGLSLTTTAENPVRLAGIMIAGTSASGIVSRNKLTGFTNSSTAAGGGFITGIHMATGSCRIDNNVINLFNGENVNPATIRGLWEEAPVAHENQYCFNTVRVGGMQSAGVQSHSYCFLRSTQSGTWLRNNILNNVRSGPEGTGIHYGAAFPETEGAIQADFNDYWSEGEGRALGLFGNNIILQIPMIPGQDTHSLSADPCFVSETDLRPLAPELDGSGVGIPEVPFDHDSILRAESPDIGAYEFTASPPESGFSGALSDAWEEAGNWDHGVPGGNTHATISDGKHATINTPAQCQHLTIEPGGALTVVNGADIQISGHLELVSNGNCHGSLLSVPGGVNVSGNTSVRLRFTGTSESWHLLSSPVGGQLVEGDFTPAGSYPDGTGYDFYLWQESTMTWMNRKAPTWMAANGGNEFAPGRGYLVAYQEVNPEKIFTGTLHGGTYLIPLTASGSGPYRHENLTGNPYPSGIDWKATAGLDKSDLMISSCGGHDYYIFNHIAGNYGVYNDASMTDEGTNGCTRYIAPMQGFFVTSGPGGGTLGMDDGARVHATSPWLKKGDGCALALRVTDSGGNFDEVRLEYGHPVMTGAAMKRYSFIETAPALYVEEGESQWSIVFLSGMEHEKPLHLTFMSRMTGEYTLQGYEKGRLPGEIVAEDCFSGETFFPAGRSYRFSYPVSGEPRRFILYLSRTGIDPRDTADRTSIRIITRPGEIKVLLPPGEKWCHHGEISLFNASGILMSRQTFEAAHQSTLLETGNLAEGIFFICVLTADGISVTRKVLIHGNDR